MQDGETGFGASRRIAGGTIARSIGEVVSKVASIAFYVMIARELGESRFGDFIFGLSLSQIVLIVAGLGAEELISREVARDKERVHDFFRDMLAVKGLLLAALWLVVVGVVSLAGYPAETKVAVALIGAGVGLEYQTKSYYAIFQARERMQYIAYSLVIQRTSTAVVGIVALLLGASLVEVCVIFAVGCVVGLLTARFWMHRYIARPRGSVDRSRWWELLKRSAPLGLVSILYLALVRLDATMIGLLASGTDNAAVGHYGAAYRLVDATMFLSVAFGGAILPWFSRHEPSNPVSLSMGFGLGLKIMIAILLPIAVVYAIFAEELIDLLYGAAYADAVEPLRILAAMTVLFGASTFVSVVLIALNRPADFTKPAVAVLIQNLIFNFILIPRYGASGAAFNAVLSGILLIGLSVPRTTRPFGGFRIVSSLLSPVAAGLAMAAVAWALGGLPWVAAAAASALAYVAVFLAIERTLYPVDFRFYANLAPGRGFRSAQPGATTPGG